MNERDFTYWLNGFIELCGEKPTAEQWECIKTHMAFIMEKKTPPIIKPINDQSVKMEPLEKYLDELKTRKYYQTDAYC